MTSEASGNHAQPTINLNDLGGRLLVASHNAGKVREISELLNSTDLDVTSAAALNLDDPEETGDTFEANAAIKAQAAAAASGMVALSDDSGLCVSALGDAPGIHTARWAGDPRDFDAAMRKVEDKLVAAGAKTTDQRKAYFVCVLCLAHPDGRTDFYRGEVHGTLVWPPRGDLGFGYDPVFQPDGFETTFGEMSADAKHGWVPGQAPGLSHRARAFGLLWDAVFA